MALFATQYTIPKLAELLHSFPHVNLSFQLANSTFEPKDPSYQESIGFLVALPVLWLVLTFLIFTIYFCIRCCRKEEPRKKTKKVTCLRVTIFIFITLTCGFIAVGFYGNDEADKGVAQFADSVENVNQTVDEAVDRIGILERIVVNINTTGFNELIAVINRYIGNITVKARVTSLLQDLQRMSDKVKRDMVEIKQETLHFRLDNISKTTNTVEYFRWMSTIVIWSWNVLICLLFLLGAVKKSKGFLIASVVLGLVNLIFVWLAGGLYLGASVAGGDLCINPGPFIEQQSHPNVRGIVHKYLTCSTEDPFTSQTEEATTAVTSANATLTRVLSLIAPYNISGKMAGPVLYVRTELKYALSNISRVGALVSCKSIHDQYVDAIDGICNKALFGFALILLASAAVGLTVTVMICLASRAWPHCSKKRGYYPVDDTDPFLPRPPPYNGYGTMPGGSMSSIPGNVSRADVTFPPPSEVHLYENVDSINPYNQQPNSDIEVLPLHEPPGDEPPPCYSYMEQYSNLGHPAGPRRSGPSDSR